MKATMVRTTKMATMSLPPLRIGFARRLIGAVSRTEDISTHHTVEEATFTVVFEVAQPVVHHSRTHPETLLECVFTSRNHSGSGKVRCDHGEPPSTSTRDQRTAPAQWQIKLPRNN